MDTVNIDNLTINEEETEYVFRDNGVSNIITDIIALNSQYAIDVS